MNAGSYLCPNELLLGRASNHAPVGMWLEVDNNKRINFLGNIVIAFWRKWQRDFFPSLVVQQNWYAFSPHLLTRRLVGIIRSAAALH